MLTLHPDNPALSNDPAIVAAIEEDQWDEITRAGFYHDTDNPVIPASADKMPIKNFTWVKPPHGLYSFSSVIVCFTCEVAWPSYNGEMKCFHCGDTRTLPEPPEKVAYRNPLGN